MPKRHNPRTTTDQQIADAFHAESLALAHHAQHETTKAARKAGIIIPAIDLPPHGTTDLLPAAVWLNLLRAAEVQQPGGAERVFLAHRRLRAAWGKPPAVHPLDVRELLAGLPEGR